MKKLITASNNQEKINEIEKVLNDVPTSAFSLKDVGLDIDVEEDGITFEENAKKKSEEIYKELVKKEENNFIVMSDDSSLEVEYLNGEPGVYSAGYAGEHGNDKKNNERLLLNLESISYDNKSARFVCQLALINDKSIYKLVIGTVNGYILEEERGYDGFGYDPLFSYGPLNKTFAELTIDEKNNISHRGIAFKKISTVIKELL